MTRVNFISRGRSFTGAHLISALELSREWGAPQSASISLTFSDSITSRAPSESLSGNEQSQMKAQVSRIAAVTDPIPPIRHQSVVEMHLHEDAQALNSAFPQLVG